jgi:hypothetical protein
LARSPVVQLSAGFDFVSIRLRLFAEVLFGFLEMSEVQYVNKSQRLVPWGKKQYDQSAKLCLNPRASIRAERA